MNLTYLRLALKAAKSANHERCFHGAVLVKHNHIISVGFNNMKSHPLAGSVKKTHAELMCVAKAGRKDIRGADIIVARINKAGNIAYSRPCPICWDVLKNYQIKRCFYTTNFGEIKEEIIS